MSFQVTEAFVEAYRDGITLRRDQEMTRLRGLVSVETGVVGASHRRDFIQSRRPTVRASRHADTILSDTVHEARWVDINTYDDADLIDDPDKVKMLSDPTNPYSTAMAQGMGREIDVVIAAGALGTTRTGVDGATSSTAPNNVNTDGNPLVLGDLQESKRLFDVAEQPEDRTWAVTASDIEDLMSITEVRDSDFNVMKVLASGAMNSYMGFNWVRVENPIIANTADPYRRTFAFVREAIWCVFGRDVKGRIDPRPDKNYSTQVFYSMTLGAARLDDDGVQEWQTGDA
jgi:hypothetical protein